MIEYTDRFVLLSIGFSLLAGPLGEGAPLLHDLPRCSPSDQASRLVVSVALGPRKMSMHKAAASASPLAQAI